MPEGPTTEDSETEESIERKVRLFEGLADPKIVEADSQAEPPLQEV